MKYYEVAAKWIIDRLRENVSKYIDEKGESGNPEAEALVRAILKEQNPSQTITKLDICEFMLKYQIKDMVEKYGLIGMDIDTLIERLVEQSFHQKLNQPVKQIIYVKADEVSVYYKEKDVTQYILKKQ